jgi:O-antigen/teichoic acid export membrane protein
MSVPVDSVELARVFRRGFAATFALDLVTSALGAATVIVLIRGLSVSTYAYTTLFLTFAQFAGAAASGGVRTRYLREEAERVSRAGGAAPKGAFVESLAKGTLLIVIVGVCAAPAAQAIGFGSKFGGGATLILYATAFATGFSAVELAVAHYQARRRFFTAGALRVLRATALLGAAFAITRAHEGVLGISLWFIGSMAALGVMSAGPIARRSLMAFVGFLRVSRFRGEEMWLSFYYVSAGGFAYVDVMVAGALLRKHQVATLGASLRYLAIVLAAIPALGAVLRVRTSQTDLIDSPANQRAMVLRWIRRAALPMALLIGGAILLAPAVIPEIDRGRYPGSIEALQIFLVTAFSAYLTAPVANVLMAQRRYAVLASVYAVGLLLNLAGDIAVARPFGVVGIAIVSTAVYVGIDLAMLVLSLRYAAARKG